MFVITATNLPRKMGCNGSSLMPPAFENVENIDRSARDEGDAAHWLAKEVFDGRFTIEELTDRKCPNGVYATSDMIDHVGEYLSALNCGKMEVETSFGNDRWRVNARADHIIYTPDLLTVDEFKYGWRPVEVEDNWTLIAHAIGYCITHGLTPSRIIFRIHQPRPMHRDGKLRTWSITYTQLMDYYTQLDHALSNQTDVVQTGPWCRGCRSLANCPAARLAEYNAIDASASAYDDSIADGLLSYELETLEAAAAVIDNRLEALRELAKHRIKHHGAAVRNYAMEPQLANTSWKAGTTAKMLQALTGKDLEKSGIVTPAEAKRRDVPQYVLDAFTERRQTGLKLVRVDTSKRAAKLLGSK